jgi:hypothetical protein
VCDETHVNRGPGKELLRKLPVVGEELFDAGRRVLDR